jgi:nitroreductase
MEEEPHDLLDLDPDELLSTTLAVRRRLDLGRPVADDTIRECVALALQAPSGGNEIVMRFVVVRDRATIKAIGEIYARCWAMYGRSPGFAGRLPRVGEVSQAQQDRVVSSASHLARHMGSCPVLVIGCRKGRLDGGAGMSVAAAMGSILPVMWSFMLAARARGLDTSWTTIHLMMEQAVAEVVKIPHADLQQVCLTPLAYTTGTDFRPALRPDPDAVIEWR